MGPCQFVANEGARAAHVAGHLTHVAPPHTERTPASKDPRPHAPTGWLTVTTGRTVLLLLPPIPLSSTELKIEQLPSIVLIASKLLNYWAAASHLGSYPSYIVSEWGIDNMWQVSSNKSVINEMASCICDI